MEKAESGSYGLDDVVVDEEVYASPVLGRVPQRMGHLLIQFLPRRLQHGLLVRLLSIIRLVVGDLDKCEWAEYRAPRSPRGCA